MLDAVRSILLSKQVLLRLLVAFLIPFVLFSVLMTVAADGINQQLDHGMTNTEKVRVGVVGADQIPSILLEELKKEGEIIAVKEAEEFLLLLEADSVDIGLAFPEFFYVDSSYNGAIQVYYNSVEKGEEARLILDILADYENNLVVQKIQEMGLNESIANPIVLQKTNTFNAFMMLGKTMETVKGILSHTLNLLLVFLVLWLARILVLRAMFIAAPSFVLNLGSIFVGTFVGMVLTFVGFRMGLNGEQEGMVKSIILSIEQLLVWNKLSSILGLWLPVWLFVIGLLGIVATTSKTMLTAYNRTFWIVVVIHLIAFGGLIPIETLNWWNIYLPIVNVFGIGQMAMKGNLDITTWYIALATTTVLAVILNLVWFKLAQRKNLSKNE